LSELRLTIELVPQSSWLNNVRAILTSAQWNVLRGSVADAAYNLCQICGGVGPKHPVECHEIWQYNDKTGIQKLTGMLALCPNCHRVKHIGFASVNGKYDRAFKHFMKVNHLKKDAAEQYIEEAFRIWRDRSQRKWKLDLSILQDYGIDASNYEGKI
jgi:hypothetical protein